MGSLGGGTWSCGLVPALCVAPQGCRSPLQDSGFLGWTRGSSTGKPPTSHLCWAGGFWVPTIHDVQVISGYKLTLAFDPVDSYSSRRSPDIALFNRC